MAQQIERNQEATIYIGNLDERCTESLVWELMLQAGPVGKVSYCFFMFKHTHSTLLS
jgi:splicing factor 3B subunit 4